ncbi:MAG: butyrate kinase [candidate division Zixibacteria bacterium]|nr:butyrate kinase [candidate division Zixibacteria bacterium]
MEKNILVINPGSTSTKIAMYKNEQPVFSEEISHRAEDLAKFESIMDQQEFREGLIISALQKAGYHINDIDCIIARGGALRPLPSGTYRINDHMLYDLKEGVYGLHASNLGAVLARRIADTIKVDAFIVDPITVTELEDIAKLSGLPDIERVSIFHALNQKAVARLAARDLGKRYADCRFIVAHLGGGISVGVHKYGRVVDVNNALNGDGPFAPTRSGHLPVWSLVELAFSGKYTERQLKEKIWSNGGVTAYLGTSDMREVKERIKQGDQKARLVYEAMAYQVAKEIGAFSAVLEGKVDAIVLSGGLARDEEFVGLIKKQVGFIADFMIYPGSDEMRALDMGAVRVLIGEEEAKEY